MFLHLFRPYRTSGLVRALTRQWLALVVVGGADKTSLAFISVHGAVCVHCRTKRASSSHALRKKTLP